MSRTKDQRHLEATLVICPKCGFEQEERVYREQEQRMTAVTGDESKADEAFAKGKEIYQQASGMAATNQRDVLYAKAQPYFEQAVAIYSAEVKKGNTAVEGKLVTANQLRYACIKMRRPF